jgi:hypothetical protein
LKPGRDCGAKSEGPESDWSMRQGDKRENRIHLESSRNGFIAHTFAVLSFWIYSITRTEGPHWNLYLLAFGPFFIFVISIVYYHQKGVKNGLSLSSLRKD